MPARKNPPTGAPIWNDLTTSDVDASVAFYTGLFGWTFNSAGPEFGGYGTFANSGRVVAGVNPCTDPGTPIAWCVYLHAPDASAVLETVTAAGGRIIVPLMEIPGQGHMAVVADPSGAFVGLWQPGLHQGFEANDEANASVWHELMTRDFAAATEFYAKAFDWTLQSQGDTDEFRYSVLQADDAQWAGVMDASGFLPESVPSHWSVYFGVTDTDAAVARAVELGGSVQQDPVDSPFGRMAALVDPQGARFKVISVLDA